MKELLRKALIKVKKWKVGEKNIFKLFFSKAYYAYNRIQEKREQIKWKWKRRKLWETTFKKLQKRPTEYTVYWMWKKENSYCYFIIKSQDIWGDTCMSKTFRKKSVICKGMGIKIASFNIVLQLYSCSHWVYQCPNIGISQGEDIWYSLCNFPTSCESIIILK